MSEQALSNENIEQIRQEFDFFDKDGNGQIDLVEFIELLTVLAPKTKASAVEEAFRDLDENGDGYIDFEEFLVWWQTCWFTF
ncbi:EF-hand domain-containing protein [Bowmanella sp. JS7-9]|uniref:EF-hand domain-containing protein n=1 Tax=Pseudobowmanella zhangzhouensis TaxID=1537679 RepID=A0ABW1XIL0_9ALTE|nr:EF-hand domain-containing protein [Bowmanella sp. JS7-9]TBX25997.1 calcium sensor EFh [Bowmanella sp. JS7-9]